jgi:glyoxylase-like metal-dependent hydrolase (beta-lactamase superfamily II)
MTSIQALEVVDNCWKIVNQPLGTNTYFILSSDKKEALVVDPGFNRDLIEDFLKTNQLRLTAVLCTHGHFDHIASVEELRKKYNAKCHIHVDDLKVVKTANFLMMACKVPGKVTPPTFEVLVTEPLQTLQFEKFPEILWIHIPGHTPGSSALCVGDKMVFTGDSLYANTVALVSLPGENPALLAKSVAHLLKSLHGEIIVLPGHGRHASVRDILRDNKELKAFLSSQNADIAVFN